MENNHKKIQLGGRNKSKIMGWALVDNDDFDELNKHRWFFDGRYAVTNIGKRKVYMHSKLLQPNKGLFCDHINGNKLDNRRSNLRIVTPLQSVRNTSGWSRSLSVFKGVSYEKRRNLWFAQIRTPKPKFLGYFSDEKDAAKAYNEAAKKYHERFAYQNIIK